MPSYDLPSYRNYGPEKTPEQRKSETAAYLYAACDAQREILSLAIKARLPFQRWSAARLKRHWHQVLSGARSQRSNDSSILEWPKKVTHIRTTDLYLNRGEEGAPSAGTGSKLSVRGEYMEQLVFRFLALQKPRARAAAIADYTQDFGEGAQCSTLAQRLTLGAEKEQEAREAYLASAPKAKTAQDIWQPDEDKWSIGALAKSVFGLVASTYIMEMTAYVEAKSPEGSAIARLCAQNIDALNAMIEVNTPAQVRAANRLMPIASNRGATMGDILSTVRLGTYQAAIKFHPEPGANGFVNYCLQTIASATKREISSLRIIQMPEAKMNMVSKLYGWRGRNLHAFSEMSLAQQMQEAGIRASVNEMASMLNDESQSTTMSVDAIAQAASESGDEGRQIASNLLNDGGGAAAQIRESAFEDPRLAMLRPAFERLSPLHQGLLASLYTCAATDGGEMAWLKHINQRSAQVIEVTVKRIQNGVASQGQVAAALTCMF